MDLLTTILITFSLVIVVKMLWIEVEFLRRRRKWRKANHQWWRDQP